MIRYAEGNLLDSDCECLVNTINTEGVMGKGIALEFKKRYPAMFNKYREACLRGEIKAGDIWTWKEPGGKLIFNAATKGPWRWPSRYEFIESCLRNLAEEAWRCDEPRIALPPLGCGNGGLEWHRVHDMILRAHERDFPQTLLLVIYAKDPTKIEPMKL